MKVQNFLEYHAIARNPFAEEDAQTDPVFKEFCIESTFHPSWDKVYGDPSEPATSIIFGEKVSNSAALYLDLFKQDGFYFRDLSESRHGSGAKSTTGNANYAMGDGHVAVLAGA